MTENARNSFSRKTKKMLVFPKNAEKNASIIEKGQAANVKKGSSQVGNELLLGAGSSWLT